MFIRTVAQDTSLDAFREEVRTFCANELPAEVRRKQPPASISSAKNTMTG